jgi:hypothetical protein
MLESLIDIHSWYNYRKKRFWLLILLFLYTFSGFFIVPWALQKQIPLQGQEYLHRGVSIGKVSFNPWTLTLQANNFVLSDQNNVSMFAFDSLVINVQTSSLFHLALTFDEISLNDPKINLVRYAFADSNFGRMLNDIEANAIPADEEAEQNKDGKEESANFRLKIANLAIRNGIIDLEDDIPSTPFNTHIEPINIAVTDLSTLPDESGTQQINVTTENGAELSWTGSLELNPLVSEGRIELSGSPLPTVYRYFETQLGFTLENCCFEIALDYQARSQLDGEVAVNVNNLDVLLSKVAIHRRGTNESVFNLPAIRINGGSLAWPEQTAHVDEFVLEQPELYIWVNADGSVNLENLLLAEAEPETVATDEQGANSATDIADESASVDIPWNVSLGEFRIDGMKFAYSDRSLPKPGNIQLNPINLSLKDISNTPEHRSPLSIDIAVSSGGSIGMAGEMTLLPDVLVDTTFTVTDLALPVIQPWAEDSAKVLIQQGALTLAGDVHTSPTETLELNADLGISNLKISDTVKDETLLGWNNLSIKQIRMKLDADDLEISQVKLLEPFARIIIAADGSTNFQSLAQDDTASDKAAAKTVIADETSAAINVRVGQTVIDNASVDFSDLSLPLPFRVLISEFGGSMSAIDSQSKQPSLLDFEGQVGEYGLTTLGGALSVMAPTDQADIQFDFRNLNMVDLSPYTAEFAGRKISSGKLDLNLNYQFENQKVIGANNIVLADFTLGEQVESEDAMSLPLDLAIALLKDVNGTIDLNVPISGDMDDPDFSASGIILKAFANLIIKAAASPFKMLGGLIPGGGDTDLENIEFLPGRADLSPPEREKLTQLSAALLMRPTLSLQVDGGYNRITDTQALQKINVTNQLASITGTTDAEAGDEQMLSRKFRKGLEKLAKQQLPGISLRALRAEFDRVDPDTGNKRFDELAYTMELRTRLEAAQPVDNGYLETLANQRSAMVIALLTSLGELDSSRIVPGTVTEVAATEDGWIAMPMNIVINDNPPVQTLEKPSASSPPQPAS